MKMIRIGDIEFKHDPEFEEHHTSEYTISKWFENEYYGKYDEYLKNGYVEDGEMISKDNIHLDKNVFNGKQHRYIIASIRLNRAGDEFDIISYGTRCFELSDNDFKDLKRVIHIFEEELKSEHESRV